MGWIDNIPLVGDAIGAIGNIISTGMTNKSNKKLSRETNALNYQMFQEGNEFNERMWNLQNEYNSPAAQRARLESAGYSPYLLAGSNQLGGVSQSTPSAAHANSAVAPTMQSPDFSMFGNFAGDIAQMALAKKYTEETKGQTIDNEYKKDRNVAEIEALRKKGKLDDATADKVLQDMTFKVATWDAQQKLLEQQSYEQYEKAQMAKLQREVYQEFGSMEMSQRINNLIQEGLLLVQKGESEKAMQKFYKTGASKNIMDGVSNRITAYANDRNSRANMLSAQTGAEVGQSQINLNSAIQRHHELENAITELFGKGKAANEFMSAYYDADMKKMDDLLKQVDVAPYEYKTGQTIRQVRNILQEVYGVFPNPVRGLLK